MKILVAGNPISGRGRADALMDAAEENLSAQGHSVETLRTKSAGQAQQCVSETDAECIVAVGGDGTVAEIITGLAGRDIPVAVIPAGTANVLARELGIPSDVGSVCQAVTNGTVLHMDTGILGNRRFLLSAGAGFDAKVIHEVAAQRTGPLSYMTYLPVVINAFMKYVSTPHTVEVDGKVVSENATFTVIANVKHYIMNWKMIPEADHTDGLLDVVSFSGATQGELVSFAKSFILQQHLTRKDVCYVQGRSVRLNPLDKAEIPMHADGDPAGHLPAETHLAPEKTAIIIPGSE